jgi:integrase
MARRWKIIQTLPEIPRLKGERERSFVFTETLRKKYDELASEPLNSFVQFSCEIGICEGEIIELLKADVHITEKADDWGHYGYLQIRKGKTEFRKRSLPITPRAKEILTAWMAKSKSDLVFTREDGVSPVSAFTLIQQQERMRNVLNLPWDACVHSARHTALTKSWPYQSGCFHFAAGRWTRQHHDDTEVRPSHAADDEGRVSEKGPQ